MCPSLMCWMSLWQAHDPAFPIGPDRSFFAGKMHNKLTAKLLRPSTGLRTNIRITIAPLKPEWTFGPIEVTNKTFPSLSKGPGIYPHTCKHREDFQHKKLSPTVSSLFADLGCQQKVLQLSAVIMWTFREEELLSNPHQDPLNEIPGYHVSPLKSYM